MADNTVTDGDIDIGIPGGLVTVTNPDASSDDVIFESLTPDRPTNIAESTDEYTQPKGQRIADGFVTASGTAQVTGGFVIRALATFTADLGEGSQDWIVSQAGPAYQKDGETKQNITARLSLE